ncbi:outer membrane protein assembly factor BamA [Desulfobulbus alkaliphilus]|uniref:outer membrane protein assembly factor BamA n=1 Tax=Desulfobulbus alkaliphilus TaxID=869814 RepID=UPI001F069905|nr:outer membrane protein assembly factor BamA [Desulfobulbus alkaliphilus]
MRSIVNIWRRTLIFPMLVCVLAGVVTLLLFPGVSRALEANTVFLPFRVNAPDAAALAATADRILERETAAKGQRMLSRGEAEQLIQYEDVWPPPVPVLETIAERAGVNYVVVGSLTRLGNLISLDCAVYDMLAPTVPYSAFREAESLEELGRITEEIVAAMLTFSNRRFTVASIVPEGNVRIDSGAILQRISTKPGDLYDPALLREDLRAVFAMGYFDNVEIEALDTDRGKRIIFRISEKPLIGSVVITGAQSIKEQDVRDAANIPVNSILNPARINEAAERVRELYRSKGYYNTEVNTVISYPEGTGAEVRLVLDEGKKITIEAITFQGNASVSDSTLRGVIQTGTHRWWISWLTASGVLKMDVLRQDADRIGAYYHNQGFIEARVGSPIVEQRDDALFITFPIEEGPRYRVGTVEIQGDLIRSQEELIALLEIRREEFLNRQVLRDDITRLTDLYAEKGYAFAEIFPRINRAATGNRVDIVLMVDKGSLVYFNRIDIQGNTRTRDNVIRRDLKMQEGGLFDSRAIRTSTQRLNRLRFFEEVNIIPRPTMNEELMDVVVEVKEQPTGQFSIGAGWSSSENLLFMGQISEDNLFGTGNRLSLSANLSSQSTRYNLTFTNPRLYDSQVSGSIDLFNWEREYDDYTKDSTGGALRIGHPLFEAWRIVYGYTLSDTNLTDIAENASSVILRSKDINLTSAAELGLIRDTRDRIFSPTTGSRSRISVNYAGGPLGGDAQFTKLEGSSSWYFPLVWSTVFHVRGAAGRVFENEDGKLPVYENFYLGGMNTIRGFKTFSISPVDPETGEKIGGDKMWNGTVSIIFPLLKNLGMDGEIFTDLGNVYAPEDSWDFSEYKHSAGFGVLWLSPLGPLRLAWGYNLDRQEGEEQSTWDFSMGGTF